MRSYVAGLGKGSAHVSVVFIYRSSHRVVLEYSGDVEWVGRGGGGGDSLARVTTGSVGFDALMAFFLSCFFFFPLFFPRMRPRYNWLL